MSFVRRISGLSKKDVSTAGGKGASLGEMTQADIPVPSGFVVLSEAFEAFMMETGLDTEIDAALNTVNHRAVHTVETASQKIQSLIENADIPKRIAADILHEHALMNAKFVAVRSSATAEDSAEAAWAGQLETYLNTTEKELLTHVQKCWASLFSPRAIFYRFEKKMRSTKVSVAVVVQEMIESEVSGIAFSVHPVTEDRNQIIIEAGFGLGEAIVSGSITPDSFVIRKDSSEIIDKQINTQIKGLFRKKDGGNEWREIRKDKGQNPALSHNETKELASLVMRIEKHYGFPVDIEWARAKGRWFILQSRPITTLSTRDIQSQTKVRGNDYLILFKMRGCMTCLHSEIFVTHSVSPADGMVVYRDGHWHSYMARATQDLCMKRGLVMFSDKKAYANYADGFRAYIREARAELLPAFRAPRCPAKTELQELLKKIGELWSYYGKTEFYYHDLAYEQALKSKDPVLLKNLKDLGILKIEGRKLLNDYIFEGGVLDNLLRGISKKFLKNDDDAKFLFRDELLGLYEGNEVSPETIKERREMYGCMSTKGKVTFLSQEEVMEAWEELHPKNSISDIKGIVTNKGRAKGRVVIAPMLVNHAGVAKVHARMKKGDILVAESTTPELMTLCKDAAAIVTDQGGMLSHAAVVSRELKIPCIIGTGHATEILKDGDLVEVNANKGVVHILENNTRLTYEFSWGERHSVMTAEMWATSYLGFREKIANENRNVLMNVEKGYVHTYTTAEDLPAAFEAGKALLSPKFLPAYLKESAEVRHTFSRLWNRVKKTNVKKLSNAQAISILREYQDVFEHIYALFKISQPEYPEAAVRRLKEILAKSFSKTQLEEAFITLTTPTATDMMKEEELTATELSLEKNLSEKDMLSYGERYAWFFFNTYDRSLANAFLKERFRELRAIPSNERRAFLKNAANELKKHKATHSRILKKLKNDKEVVYLAKLLGTLGNDRLELKKWWTGSEYLFLDFFAEIARRLGLDTEEYLMTYRLSETYRALASGKRLTPQVRTERKNQYAVVLSGDEVKFLESKEAAAFVNKYLKPSENTAYAKESKIQGTIANTGKAVGIARLIRVEDLKELLRDMERFKKGEIIVTTMTQPTMASMARKAAAIVTNEGGITSHASILAREFGIPCIVGTKTATSLINDGDKIEVDANKGIVKVLSEPSFDIEWVHYITRPFTLLGASLWREWYATEHIVKTLGVTNTEARFLEVFPDVVRYYREKKQMESLQQAARDIVRNDPKKLKVIFNRGNTLNAAAKKMLKKGWSAVSDFETAVDTVIKMAIHATVVPFLTLAKFDELKVSDAALRETAEQLRAQSLYPRFFAEIVTPHAEHLVKKLGVNPRHASLLTVEELRKKDTSQLAERIQRRNEGLRFIYTYAHGKETIQWTHDIDSEVRKMEHITKAQVSSVQGQTAFKGKAIGTARLVLTDNPKGIHFNEGDILVSINSTPALMPLIVKSAALVTDEGGISCHAAIVSRELKKPCVMSTKLATSVIKDGDTIEVDAIQGIVKVLKRA